MFRSPVALAQLQQPLDGPRGATAAWRRSTAAHLSGGAPPALGQGQLRPHVSVRASGRPRGLGSAVGNSLHPAQEEPKVSSHPGTAVEPGGEDLEGRGAGLPMQHSPYCLDRDLPLLQPSLLPSSPGSDT